MKWLVLMGAACGLILGGMERVRANSILYGTPSGASTGGGPVDAQASFTLGNGTVTVTLTNYEKNPTSDPQTISGIKFNLDTATGAGTLSTVNSGLISTIYSGGSYTAGVRDSLTRWVATESGASIDLTTLSGGTPNRLIIGPDSKGNYDPTLGGLYNNANSSIINHDPNVLGSATFTLSVPGVSNASKLSNVVFEFATNGQTVNGVEISSTPEPNSLILLSGFGIFGLMSYAWRWRKMTPRTC